MNAACVARDIIEILGVPYSCEPTGGVIGLGGICCCTGQLAENPSHPESSSVLPGAEAESSLSVFLKTAVSGRVVLWKLEVKKVVVWPAKAMLQQP